VLEDTYYGMGQDIAVSMLQMAAAPPTSTPPVMVDPDVVNLLMRPATTTGMVLNWLSLDDGSAQQHHFPSLTMGAIWFQNQNYCEVFDNLYFCISHPPLQAGPVTNTVHATRDSAMLMAFENHYVAMIAALEQSSAQQRLNPIAPVAPDPQSRKFFRITADWSLDSDGDLTPDWVEWMAMQGKEGLQAITTVTKPDGSSYQVNANPFSADANPDSSGGLAPLDCDGDTIADIEDADMTSKQVNWKKILATRYALFALPTPPIPAEPSVGVEPLQINSQGTVLFPRHAWKNDQLVTLQLSPSALQDLAQAYSINDSGNIFGVGYDYNTVPFVMKSSADPPVALRAAVDDIQITGQGSQFSAKPGITNSGRFLTNDGQTSTQPIENPVSGTFLWHLANNQVSYQKIDTEYTHYADPGFYWRHAYSKTFMRRDAGAEVELDGILERICETPTINHRILLGFQHAYVQTDTEPWLPMEKFANMLKFSRAGIGFMVDQLWINSNTYFSPNYAPEFKDFDPIKDMSNAGHLLISHRKEDGGIVYLAGFPFQIEDNEFATGVDHTSCSAAYIMKGYQDKIWIMAPQGTWKDGANVEHNNSNALVVKSALDTASLTCSCPHALFNGAAAEVALTGDATPIEISGIGATTVDDKLVLTMGSNMAASYPIGVKSMK
jgi:hypothetical protein